MPSFRNSMGFIAVAALVVAIGIVVRAQHTSNASAPIAFAVVGLPIVAVKAPPEFWFPRASTYADEVANANHEGF